MMQGLSAARLGLSAQQKRVDTIANNIANLNTAGYRATEMRFQETLYTAMKQPDPVPEGSNMQLGTGVRVSATLRSLAPGAPLQTGEPLDLCLTGEGYFTLDCNGEIGFTREGRFGVSLSGEDRFLVTAQGYHVLDENLERIAIPRGEGELRVDEGGNLTLDGQPLATLNLVSFVNAPGLASAGDNTYRATVASGQPAAGEVKVTQGALESSNVDVAREMTRLIRAQRSFSLAGRALSNLDAMQAQANNIR